MAIEPFDKQLSEKPLEQLECRVWGHNLVPTHLDPGRPGKPAFHTELMCSRGCGYEVDYVRDWTGQIKRRQWYDPAKNYGFRRIGGRPDADQRSQIVDALQQELQYLKLPRPAESKLPEED